MKHLLELHRVAAVLAGFARVCALAKLAIDDANVRVIDVSVYVVVGDIAVEPLAYIVRKTAKRDEIPRPIELDAFFQREPLATPNLISNGRHDAEIIHDPYQTGTARMHQLQALAFVPE